MELRHLRYFVAVADHGGFRHAAQVLGIAQPALSRQIATLERSLGARLFERGPRGVHLSDAGRSLLEDAREILATVARSRDRVRRLEEGLAGDLTIGLNEIAARHPAVSAYLAEAHVRFPGLRFTLVLMASHAQVAALRAGEIDCGFLFNPFEDPRDIASRHVADDAYDIALSTAHRFAGLPSPSLGEFAVDPFILPSPFYNPAIYQRHLLACLGAGFVPRQAHEANTESLIASLVAAGAGVAILNRSFGRVAPEGVVLRSVEGLAVPVSLELSWIQSRMNRLLARFVGLELERADPATGSEC